MLTLPKICATCATLTPRAFNRLGNKLCAARRSRPRFYISFRGRVSGAPPSNSQFHKKKYLPQARQPPEAASLTSRHSSVAASCQDIVLRFVLRCMADESPWTYGPLIVVGSSLFLIMLTSVALLRRSRAAARNFSSLPLEFTTKPANCAAFNYGPASGRDSIVLTCERPGGDHGTGQPGSIPEAAVEEWARFMKEKGVHRVLTLLDDNEVELYAQPLFGTYRKLGFIADHVPMGGPDAVKRVLAALDAASAAGEAIVAHCTHGMGRSGRVAAAWLVHKYGLSAEEATKEAMATAEASSIVRLGNAEKLAAWMTGGDKAYAAAMGRA